MATVVAIACVVYASAIALHELAHALTGLAVGGQPTLISSTDVRGNWENVGQLGFMALGMSGSAVNWLLAVLGIIWIQRARPRSSARFFPWLLLAVNGFIPSVYMVASPLLGFGDWMTILSRFQHQLILRVFIAIVGINVAFAWFALVSRWLTRIVAGVPEGRRIPLARRLTLTSWLTGGVLAVAAALLSPLGLPRALLIAAGSTLGTTFLILPAARLAESARRRVAPTIWDGVGPGLVWTPVGTLLAAVFIFFLGRGIQL